MQYSVVDNELVICWDFNFFPWSFYFICMAKIVVDFLFHSKQYSQSNHMKHAPAGVVE